LDVYRFSLFFLFKRNAKVMQEFLLCNGISK